MHSLYRKIYHMIRLTQCLREDSIRCWVEGLTYTWWWPCKRLPSECGCWPGRDPCLSGTEWSPAPTSPAPRPTQCKHKCHHTYRDLFITVKSSPAYTVQTQMSHIQGSIYYSDIVSTNQNPKEDTKTLTIWTIQQPFSTNNLSVWIYEGKCAYNWQYPPSSKT